VLARGGAGAARLRALGREGDVTTMARSLY
jgi:hypothetical protein